MPTQEKIFENAVLQITLGTPSRSFWSGVGAFTNADETVVLVLSINPKTESSDLKIQGEEILEYFENRYKTEIRELTLSKLSKLVGTTITRFDDARVNLQVGVLKGKSILLSTQGGEVRLIRGGNEYKLISEESKEKSMVGPVVENDVFILSVIGAEQELASEVEISPKINKFETTNLITENVHQQTTTNRNYGLGLFSKSAKSLVGLLTRLKGRKTQEEVRENIDFSKERHNQATLVSVGLVLILLLFISIGFGLFQKTRKEEMGKYEPKLIEAQKSFEDSLVQYTLNSRVAKELFLKAQDLTKVLKEEGVVDDRLTVLESKIAENAGKLLGVVNASTGVFLDLTLVRENIDPQELVLDDEKLAILDKTGDRVITLLTDATRTTTIGGTEKLGSLISVATYAGRVFVLSEKGILEVFPNGNVSIVVQPDEEWGTPIKARAFGSNLYLSTQEGEIWRFPAIVNGFATKQRWLGPGVILSPGLRDMALDGSIWVLSDNSRIQKYSRGAPNSFSVNGVSFSNAVALYTDEKIDSLFVLDSENSRIIQLSKTGELEKEYKSDELKLGRDLVVSAKVGKILILANSKILEIPLAR